MDYFYAVQEGKARVKKALEVLQGVAGPSYPTLFLKVGPQDWIPVGEENLFSVLNGKNGTAAVVICDADGNSKAMSPWVPASSAEKYAASLASIGLPKYEGEVKLPI